MSSRAERGIGSSVQICLTKPDQSLDKETDPSLALGMTRVALTGKGYRQRPEHHRCADVL